MMNNYHEYLILGAGPAGVQTGYFMQNNNLDYFILERNDKPASFFEDFPRHRKLISINKVYTGYENDNLNMRWDWNSLISDDPKMLLKEYTKEYFPNADRFVDYVGDFTRNFKLNVAYNVSIKSIAKNEEGNFELSTHTGEKYTCKHLIMGTGMSRPYIPEIEGVELTENYFDVSVDPEDFVNQAVLIIGKGNSAFETADNLVGTTRLIHLASPSVINFAWRTHYVGHLRAVNNNFLDTYQLKSQNGVINGDISKIERKEDGKFVVEIKYTTVNGEEVEELHYDRVITCCGFKFDETIFEDNAMPKMEYNDRFPKVTAEWESDNIDGLYFIGSPTHGRDYKMATSGFIHGFRYNCEALVRMLMKKNHQTAIEKESVGLTADEVTDIIIKRVNLSSALWQQFGFFGDLVLFSENEKKAHYYDGLPTDYIHESMVGDEDYLIVTLEYGKSKKDPFDHKAERVNRFDYDNAADSLFLHPIITRYNKGEMVDKIDLIEDLNGEFDKEEGHIKPLREYLKQRIGKSSLVES